MAFKLGEVESGVANITLIENWDSLPLAEWAARSHGGISAFPSVCFWTSAGPKTPAQRPTLLTKNDLSHFWRLFKSYKPLYIMKGAEHGEKRKVTSTHPHLCTLLTHFPFQFTAVHLPWNTKIKLITKDHLSYAFFFPKIKYHEFTVCFILLFFFLFPLNSPPNKTRQKKPSWLLPEENVIRESPAPPVARLSRRCTEGRYLQTKSQPPPLGASKHKLLLKITRIRDKLRKTSRFKTASSLPFPLRQAACLWQTWVWESFHTLMCLGKM